MTWNELLRDQLDFHWEHQLQPRLRDLTDEEYLWEPVPGAWNVRPRDSSTPPTAPGTGPFTIDFAWPEPVPAPVTTIAWRLAHVTVGCLAMRSASHFGRPTVAYESFAYAGTAAEALRQLDDELCLWRDGVRSWDDAALLEPCGPAEGPFADYPRAALVLHIQRELIHHLAEVSLLRDLYAHTHPKES